MRLDHLVGISFVFIKPCLLGSVSWIGLFNLIRWSGVINVIKTAVGRS